MGSEKVDCQNMMNFDFPNIFGRPAAGWPDPMYFDMCMSGGKDYAVQQMRYAVAPPPPAPSGDDSGN